LKQIALFISLLTLAQLLFAQKVAVNEYASIDKKALQLPDSLAKTTVSIAAYMNLNFKTEKEKSRAIFIWIASNIQYDVENMYAINFYEKKEDKISKPLKTRKGICENYAALFNDVCAKTGITSYIIEGYTKQNAVVNTIPHAWCAALIDSSWYLFDPTWGSGFVNGGKFFKKINNDFFKVNPSSLINSHMPFDYLWQFVNYPVTNQEFYEGKTQQNKSKTFFNFADSIRIYESQSYVEKLISSARRIEQNGVKNSLIFDRLQHIKLEIENIRQTDVYNLFNNAVSDYNEGINGFNDFIQYRNKQFTPVKPDPEIQNMLDAAESKIKEAKTNLFKIENPDANTTSSIIQLTKSINDASIQVAEQKDWLKLYFSKGKSGRKSMFYDKKVTWFGIPLN